MVCPGIRTAAGLATRRESGSLSALQTQLPKRRCFRKPPSTSACRYRDALTEDSAIIGRAAGSAVSASRDGPRLYEKLRRDDENPRN